ncbi:MAG: hypothetical protein ACKVQB_03500, partial [Bacteroidia bacterium]
MKILKKISRGFLLTICFVVFFLIIAYTLVRSRHFQNWAAQKTVNYLAKEFKTKVSLKSIDFELIDQLVLEGLYIEDRQGDTLVYFGKLKASFNSKIIFDSKQQLAKIRTVVMENTKINMVIHRNQKDFNYQFIVDYFSAPKVSGKPFVPFKLIINNLEFKNVDYCFRDENVPKAQGRKFDEAYMHYKGINAQVYPFKLIGDSLNLNISHLSFKEKSGLDVKEFSANTIISSTVMEFSNLIFKTPYSRIGNYLKFSYNGYKQFSHFLDSVEWKANLAKSVVSMRDIGYFSDDLLNYNFPITMNGIVSGTLSNLKGKKMDIVVGKLNSLKGDILLKDVTDPEKMIFDLDISDMLVNPSSIQDLTKIKLPIELLRIGSVRYMGTFIGAIKDFTTKGLISTTIGSIKTDLNLKFPDGKPEQYKGELDVFNFDLAKLLNNGTLGNLNLSAVVDGKGFTIEDLNTKLQGKVQSFVYNGYNYTNATLDGVLEKKLFDGKFEIKDPNVNFSFNGKFDINKENPGGDFTAQAGIINLSKLGYGDIDIKQIDKVGLTFEGHDIDDMKINTTLNNVVLKQKDSTYYLGTIDLDAFGSSSNRSVELKSILGNIVINGQFKISQFSTITNNLLYNLFPDYYASLKTNSDPVNIRFDIDINDSRFLSALVLPELTFSKFTTTGVYNSSTQNLDLLARADYLKYQDYKFRELTIESSKQVGQRLALIAKSQALLIKDSLITNSIVLTSDLGANDINFSLNVADSNEDVRIKSGGNIAFS